VWIWGVRQVFRIIVHEGLFAEYHLSLSEGSFQNVLVGLFRMYNVLFRMHTVVFSECIIFMKGSLQNIVWIDFAFCKPRLSV